jgi:hypothetical protein
LQFADAWRQEHGSYPTSHSGKVREGSADTWTGYDLALRLGLRGLSGGTSLAKLLRQNRNAPRVLTRKKHTVEQILSWADAWRERTGKWPLIKDGSIPEAPGETWSSVSKFLSRGASELGYKTTLPKLLNEMRGVPIYHVVPALNEETILEWADRYHERTGNWPKSTSGDIPEAPGDTWARISWALNNGSRSLKKWRSIKPFIRVVVGLPHPATDR